MATVITTRKIRCSKCKKILLMESLLTQVYEKWTCEEHGEQTEGDIYVREEI